MVQQRAGQERDIAVDPESVAEVAWITKWQQLVTQSMGGLLPECSDLSAVQKLLDIACGSGAWTLELAFAYAQMEILGIDVNRTSIRYALAQAEMQGLENVDFQIMDALENLTFPDHTFDIINAQFIDNRIPVRAWPEFLQHCQRVLRPGGIMRILSSELIITTSKAYEELLRLSLLALHKAGYCTASNGYYTGNSVLLVQEMRRAGYQQVQQRAYVIDFSNGTKASEDNYRNFSVYMQLLKPFLQRMEVVTEERFETLYREATIDLLSDNCGGMWYFLTIWGSTPT
jgi:ubiquinone/menaquinone biosynthesis C-methylase UbiE